jgi:hypothetical protein
MKIGPPPSEVVTAVALLENPLGAATLEPHLSTESGQSSDEELVATPLTSSEDVSSDETPSVDIAGTVDKKLESHIQGLQSQVEPLLPAEPEGPAVETPQTSESVALNASDGVEAVLASLEAQDPHAGDHEPNVSDEDDTNNSNLKPVEPAHISSPDAPKLETVDPGTDEADGAALDHNTVDSDAAEADAIGYSPNEQVPVGQDATKTDSSSVDDEEDVSDNYPITDDGFVVILPEWFEEQEEGEGTGESNEENTKENTDEEAGESKDEENGEDNGEEKGEESGEEEPEPQHDPFQHESKGHGVFGPDDDSDDDSDGDSDNDSDNDSDSDESESDAAAAEKKRKSERVLSPAEKEWARQKEQFGETNEALDTLMSMVGVESVKTAFLCIKAVIDSARARKGVLNRRDLNLVLTGNPGTGKNLQRGKTL